MIGATLARIESRAMASLEALASIAAIGLLALLVAAPAMIGEMPLASRLASGAGAAMLIVMDTWFLVMLRRHWRDHPVSLRVAESMPKLPLPLRPLAAVAWLAHALVGAALVGMMELGHSSPSLTTVLLGWLLGGACTWATIGYVLLAVASIAPRPELLELLWRRRLVLVAMVLAGAAALPYLGMGVLQRPGLVLRTPEAVVTVVSGADAPVPISVRNAGSTSELVVRDALASAVRVEIVLPDGTRHELPRAPLVERLRFSRSAYARLEPGETLDLGVLRLPSTSLASTGRHHLVVRYEDRGGLNFGAPTSCTELHATVVVR